MLRNRGVHVTEKKIRQDVLRAYEQDIFEVPHWRYQEPGCQVPYTTYRQPRYRAVPKQVYHTVRSSISSYGRDPRSRGHGARRIYLPENEWGASSAESMVFIRNPRYNTGSYYPNEVFARPFRRDYRYPDGNYSRKASSIYMDEDVVERYHATRDRIVNCPRKQTQLVRKVTRKLSPIFTCECATTSNTKQRNKTNIYNHSPKPQTQLSKEAKKLSLDVYKILSLLQKDDEIVSSISLLQNIHDLDCRNSNSGANLITQRVQISSKMPKQKQNNPSERFKTATGVKSKIEALISALKQYEEEKMLNDLDSSDVANIANNNNYIPSDSPSIEDRFSINENDKRSSTNIDHAAKQKDIDLQTEKPKTSNKNVCSTIKTKKDNMIIEKKSLRSRLSWKKREAIGFEEKIGSTLDAKQGQSNNKAGLMIKIGGNPQRKNTKVPKEKQKDKMPKTWIKKFLDNTKDAKNNNIHVRWNNKGFYSKSSSTIFELVNNVYKQLGIKDYAKSDEISVSDIKKAPIQKIHKCKSRIPKPSNKPKHKQKLTAYMVPQTIVPGPVYMPRKATNSTKKDETEEVLNTNLSSLYKKKRSLYKLAFKKQLNTINYLCSKSFEIHMPSDFFGPNNLSFPFLHEEENKIVEYGKMRCNPTDGRIDNSVLNDRKYDLNIGIYLNMVQTTQSLTACLDNRSEVEETNMIQSKPESEITISRLQVLDCSNQDTESHSLPKRSCSLVDKIIKDEYLNWMPESVESFHWDDTCKDSAEVLPSNDQVASIISVSASLENADVEIEIIDHENTTNKIVNKAASKKPTLGFRKIINRTFSSNLVRWKDGTKKTISGNLLGVNCKKPGEQSVLWSLLWELLKSPRHKQRPPLDLSFLRPPKIVSEPECCYNPHNSYTPQQPRSSPAGQTTEKGALHNEPIITENLTSLIRSSYPDPELDTEKEKTIDESPTSRISPDLTHDNQLIHNTDLKTTEKSENTLILDKSSLPEDIANFASTRTKSERTVPSKTRITSRIMQLIRSDHNIRPQKNIDFLMKPSVPLLQKHLLLISVGTQQHLIRTHPIKCQLQNHNQVTNIQCKSDIQGNKLNSDHNHIGPEKTIESSRDRVEKRMHVVSNETLTDKDIKEKEETKSCNNDTKNRVEIRVPSFKNNMTSPNNNCTDINKTSPMKLSLKITNGDKITKISIKNHDRNKVNDFEFIEHLDSQETAVNRDPNQQSSNTISNNKVKVFINITNMKAKKVENEHTINETADTSQKETNNSFNAKLYKTGNTLHSQQNSVHKSLRTHSRSKSRAHTTTNMTRPYSIYGSDFQDYTVVDKTPSIESLNNIIAENDLKELHSNTADKRNTDNKNVNHVVAVKRLLNAMLMLNASNFTIRAFRNELATEQNKSYTSLSEKILRRKELVNILSDINMAHRIDSESNSFLKLMEEKDSFDELESGDSCSGCNVLTRKINSHRFVHGSTATCYKVREQGNIAANYNIPHLTNPVMKTPRKPLDDFVFPDTVDAKMSSQTITSRVNETTTKEHSQIDKPICWYCGKRSHKKYLKKYGNNEKIKEPKPVSKHDALCKSKKSLFTEYKVIVKNNGSFDDEDTEMNSSDILQSQKIKKAVLQIYSETVANEGYLVVKIPKYLRL